MCSGTAHSGSTYSSRIKDDGEIYFFLTFSKDTTGQTGQNHKVMVQQHPLSHSRLCFIVNEQLNIKLTTSYKWISCVIEVHTLLKSIISERITWLNLSHWEQEVFRPRAWRDTGGTTSEWVPGPKTGCIGNTTSLSRGRAEVEQRNQGRALVGGSKEDKKKAWLNKKLPGKSQSRVNQGKDKDYE